MAEILFLRPDLIDQVDQHQYSALTHAADAGHLYVVEELLKLKPMLNLASHSSRSPLSYAAKAGHKTILELLVQHGAKVDQEDRDGRSPLLWAIGAGQLDVASFLMSRDATLINHQDKSGKDARTYAAMSKSQAMVDLLNRAWTHP